MKHYSFAMVIALSLCLSLPVTASEASGDPSAIEGSQPSSLLIQRVGESSSEDPYGDIDLDDYTTDEVTLELDQAYLVLTPLQIDASYPEMFFHAVFPTSVESGGQIDLITSHYCFDSTKTDEQGMVEYGSDTVFHQITVSIDAHAWLEPFVQDLFLYKRDGSYIGTIESEAFRILDQNCYMTQFTLDQIMESDPYYIGFRFYTYGHDVTLDDSSGASAKNTPPDQSRSDSGLVPWVIGIGIGIMAFSVALIFRKKRQ